MEATKKDLTAKDQEIGTLQQEITELNKKTEELNYMMSMRESASASEGEQLKKRFKELELEKEKMTKDHVKDLQEKDQDREKEVAAVQKNLKEADNHVADLNREIEKLKAQNQQLDELDKIKQQRDDALKDVIDLGDKLKAAKADRDATSKSIEELEKSRDAANQ